MLFMKQIVKKELTQISFPIYNGFCTSRAFIVTIFKIVPGAKGPKIMSQVLYHGGTNSLSETIRLT